MSKLLKERWEKLAFGSNKINEAPNYSELSAVDRGETSKLEPLARNQTAGMDPAGQSNVPAPENPDNGLIYEETVKNEFEKARKVYFDDVIDNSVGALNPPSDDNSYDVSIEMPQQGGLGFATKGNQVLKAELKVIPARFGSLRLSELDSFEFTGTGFEWTWNSGVSEVEKAGSDPVLEKLSADTGVVSWLSSTVSKIENRLKAGGFDCKSMLPLSVKQGLSVSAHEACGGTGFRGENYAAIATIVQNAMNENDQKASKAMEIPGSEWIELMGVHKDIILLGSNPHQCSGMLFSLNNKTASHFPIIQVGTVSVRFRIARDTRGCGMRIEASPGAIENQSDGKIFNSGLELYDRLVRTMPGFESSFDKAAQGIEQAGQDTTVEDAISAAADQFLTNNPGSTADRERDRRGIPNALRTRQALKNYEEDDILPLGTESHKRKYSIAAKLLK